MLTNCGRINDPEPFNRLLLLQAVDYASLSPEDMERLRTDSSTLVRRSHIHALLNAGLKPPQEHLMDLAMDPTRSLRELGQFYLKKDYSVDPYQLYCQLDGDPFYFITDYARKEDAGHFIEGIRIGSKKTKLLCLRALAAVDPNRITELDVPALITGDRKLRTILVPHLPRVFSEDELLALRAPIMGDSLTASIILLLALEKRSFWAFADAAMSELLSDPPNQVSETISATILRKTKPNLPKLS